MRPIENMSAFFTRSGFVHLFAPASRAVLVLSFVLLTSFLPLGAAAPAAQVKQISFNQEIRPILSDHCFKCHGTDDKTRKGKLRLDDPKSAGAPAKSGSIAVIAGDPDGSELIKRIFTHDEDDLMPPSSNKKPLKPEQKELLKKWIAQGAKYEPHWAFAAPRTVVPPSVKNQARVKNPIDQFVLARLEKEGITPSAEADRYTLIRRLHLDLTGLPPTPEAVKDFVADTRKDAYARVVDQLLDSPHYGERWGRRWLDLARYADSNGYEKDRKRSIWPYRDWVIDAINRDMPFDQFTIKQLAGDMLPNASHEDRVATGFHRNTMLNEEGGTDPLEFRYLSLVDRVGTTGTAWLGLTLACAQCHTHKYDPITHQEYFSIFAFLNTADEIEIPVPDAQVAFERSEAIRRVREMEENLPSRFPVAESIWKETDPTVSRAGEGTVEKDEKRIWRFAVAEKDTFQFVFDFAQAEKQISSIKLETFPDEKLPEKYSGHSSAGNFVVSEAEIQFVSGKENAVTNSLKIARAMADFAQDGFGAEKAIDGDLKTGWAVQPKAKESHWIVFDLSEKIDIPAGSKILVNLKQEFGSKHVMARARVSLGVPVEDQRPVETRRKEALEQRFARWDLDESEKSVRWSSLPPSEATSNEPILTILDDHSILASGDQTKSDTYKVKYRLPKNHKITALRLETLPHASLPKGGPGRVYYEGTPGDFLLNEFQVLIDGKEIKFSKSSQAATIDKDPLTGWSIGGKTGQPHQAVYLLDTPLDSGAELEIKMLFERYYATGLGRFRISITTESPSTADRGLTSEIETITAKPKSERTDAEKMALFRHFLLTVPELTQAREDIKNQKEKIPQSATTLIFTERPPKHARKTHLHHRGEFLQSKEEVTAGVPAFLPQLPDSAPKNRLGFARWLVSPENPLTSRVTVNRQWQAFFGRGLVRTLDDFGFQGAVPSHPELLDWLAQGFVADGWSMKRLHRLIVTSATYQQASMVREDLIQRDPENILLTRGPRFRVDAETIRDAVLQASGLLSPKMGGPSVFPPQPASITTEGSYQAFTWNISTGEDRHRRSLYTFAKRTAPFAFYNTFDAPTGEACVPRREVSNTPLQALALLNDVLMIEASQALGGKLSDQKPSPTIEEKINQLYLRCLGRPADSEEQVLMQGFYQKQLQRFNSGELDPVKVAGKKSEYVSELAAWTSLARAVFNFDEFVTRE